MDDGRYTGRAVGSALGFSSNGKQQIAVALSPSEGPFAGDSITWYGYFTDAAHEITFRQLRTLGWHGDDLTDMTGIDANEVSFTVKSEEYDGKTRQKVAGIFPLGGVVLKDRMSPEQAKTFAAQMRGAAVASRAGTAPTPKPKGKAMREPGDDTDDLGF